MDIRNDRATATAKLRRNVARERQTYESADSMCQPMQNLADLRRGRMSMLDPLRTLDACRADGCC
jgi:hypothetical protein